MCDVGTRSAMRTAARVAFRAYDALIDEERDAVLVALVELEEQPAAEVAQETLHHLRQQRAKQMLLKGLIT